MADELSAESTESGWTLGHAQEPVIQRDETGSIVKGTPGHYVAFKREGTTLIERGGETLENVQAQIDDWENSRPRTPEEIAAAEAEVPAEQRLASGMATVHSWLSSGARQAGEVNVNVDPATEQTAEQVRVEQGPSVAVVAIEEDGSIGEQRETYTTHTDAVEDASGATGLAGGKSKGAKKAAAAKKSESKSQSSS